MARPSFHFSFSWPDKIWQVVIDETSAQLAVELRDEASQRLSYQLISFRSEHQSPIFELEEADWWTTMIRLSGSFLMLERYNDPQDPLDKDLLIYNTTINAIHQVLSKFQLIAVKKGQLIGHTPGDQQDMRYVDLDMGVHERSIKAAYPIYYSPGSPAFKTVAEFLQLEDQKVGCEYLEHGNHIIIAYYIRLGTKFDRKLLVMQRDVELYHEVLDTQLTGFASGSFFIFNDILVFIQNGHQLHGIELYT